MTPRQQLIQLVAREIVNCNMTVIRHNMGDTQPHVSADTVLKGFDIELSSEMVQWNAIIEQVAKTSGGDVWAWYLNANDSSYNRIVNAIRKEYQERMFINICALRATVNNTISSQRVLQ